MPVSRVILNLAFIAIAICSYAAISPVAANDQDHVYNIGDVVTLTAENANAQSGANYVYVWSVFDNSDSNIDVAVIDASDMEKAFKFYAPVPRDSDGIFWVHLTMMADTSLPTCVGFTKIKITVIPEVPGTITVTPTSVCADSKSFNATYSDVAPIDLMKVFWYLDSQDWDHVIGVDTGTLEIPDLSNIPAGFDSENIEFKGDKAINLVSPATPIDHKIIFALAYDEPSMWPPQIVKEVPFKVFQLPSPKIY